MKIPRCKCGYMLAARTITLVGREDGMGFCRTGTSWVCANPDCDLRDQEVTPHWVEVKES